MGVGQGNGLGPALWALISTILLDMMDNARHGVNLCSPITNTTLCLIGFSFLDNADLAAALGPNASGEALVEEFQAALDRWAGGLVTAGGELAPENAAMVCETRSNGPIPSP